MLWDISVTFPRWSPGVQSSPALIVKSRCLYPIYSFISEVLWWVLLVLTVSFLLYRNCRIPSFGESQFPIPWALDGAASHDAPTYPPWFPAQGPASADEKEIGLEKGDLEGEEPPEGGQKCAQNLGSDTFENLERCHPPGTAVTGNSLGQRGRLKTVNAPPSYGRQSNKK